MSEENKPGMTLADVLRENARKRPAAFAPNSSSWRLVEGGIQPVDTRMADCHVRTPARGGCYSRPEWVVETDKGYFPTCSQHMGTLLNSLLREYSEYAEVAMYFHPYKGN